MQRPTVHIQSLDAGAFLNSRSNAYHSQAMPAGSDELEHHRPLSIARERSEVAMSSTRGKGYSPSGHSASSHFLAAQASVSNDSRADGQNSFSLPAFISPLSKKVAQENLKFLEQRGALSVPEPSLRIALIYAYIDFVYCYLPAIDLPDFLESVEREDGQISLLLFQAIMFAGSAFVDMGHLRAAGFRTRREARNTLFNKTRVSHMIRLLNGISADMYSFSMILTVMRIVSLSYSHCSS